jgi:hypothetical protein
MLHQGEPVKEDTEDAYAQKMHVQGAENFLWESENIQSTPGKTIKLRIVDCHTYSPTLWIDRCDGMVSERMYMKLEERREIKHSIAEVRADHQSEEGEADRDHGSA